MARIISLDSVIYSPLTFLKYSPDDVGVEHTHRLIVHSCLRNTSPSSSGSVFFGSFGRICSRELSFTNAVYPTVSGIHLDRGRDTQLPSLKGHVFFFSLEELCCKVQIQKWLYWFIMRPNMLRKPITVVSKEAMASALLLQAMSEVQ